MRTDRSALKPAQRLEFLNQLSLLLEAKVALIEALQLLQDTQPDASVVAVSQRLIHGVGQGQSLAQAMGQLHHPFDSPTRALVAAGEASGTLSAVLRQMVTDLRNRQQFAEQLVQALAYPVGIFFIALAVAGVLLWWVVPQFQSLFDGFGAALPAATQLVIALSQLLKHTGWHALLGTLLVTTFGIYLYRQHPPTRQRLDGWADHVPLLGVVFKQQRAAKTSQLLATLLGAGLPLTQAIDLAIQAAHHSHHRQALQQVAKDIRRGQPFSSALSSTQAFDPMMVHLCFVGEQSGQIDTMLRQASELLQAKVNIRLQQLSKLLEPFMMVAVGLLVGGLLIALYLPIFKMTDVMM